MRDSRLNNGASIPTRGLRVLAGVASIAIVTAYVTAGTFAASPAEATTITASTKAVAVTDSRCADVLFVGVRGSGERADEYDGLGPKVSLMLDGFTEALDSSLTYRSMALDYPSLPIAPADGFDGSLVGDLISYGVGLPPSPTRNYADSIQQGTFALLDAVVASNRDCPDERIVLAGYSQGALVIHRVLSETTLGSKLAAVVLLADPARDTIHGNPQSGTFFGNAGDSLGIWLEPIGGVAGMLSAAFGPALSGTTLYFASQPSTNGYELWDAAAAASNPHMAFDPAVAAKTIEMCAATDLVCDTQLGFGGDWYWAAIGTHTHYGTDDAAAGFRAADVKNLGALAAERIPRSEWQYTVDHAGRATITGTTVTSKDLRIPGTVGGYSVVAIGDDALRARALRTVVIPPSVKTIGSRAFRDNSLRSAVIPDSVTTIGDAAFSTNSLTSVDLPAGLTALGNEVFYSNELSSVVVAGSVSTIGNRAFALNRLTSVAISSGVTTIGDDAFAQNQLTGVQLPGSVTAIGTRAFARNRLTSVEIPGSVTTIGPRAFEANSLASVVIRDGVKTIGSSAFQSNALTNLVIAGSVTTIGERAFNGSALGSVDIPGSVSTIGTAAFASNKLTSAVLRSGVTTIGDNAFASNPMTSLVLPSSVRTIGQYAFYDTALTKVTIPYGVATIGDNAFSHSKVSSVVIPNSVTTIGFGAFSSNALTSVVYPVNVTDMGADVFAGNALTSVVIPAGVTTIGPSAFAANALTSVVIPDGVTTIGYNAFSTNSLANVVIPGSVTTIQSGAFSSNSLANVVIPGSVTTIGEHAFSVNRLTEVVVPASVTMIGPAAFHGNGLMSVKMMGDAPRINAVGGDPSDPAGSREGSFGNDTSLTVTFPAGASGYTTPVWMGYKAAPAGMLAMTSAVPSVSGTPAVGWTLTAKPGSWTAGATLKYQWLAGGVVISGATGSTFKVGAAQKDKQISVRVTGSKPGYATAATTSALTARVIVTALPTVSGTVAVGSTLTAKPGTWTSGATLKYQWLAGGVAISGATGSTFKVGSAQKDKQISVRVTGSKPGYATAATTSALTARVIVTALPTVSGTVAVGSTLTAKPGTWTSGATLKYQWLAGGVAISGATGSTFKVGSAQKDKQISVRVTGSKPGYATAATTSALTARVMTLGTPSIAGTGRVGSILTAKPGIWTTGVTFTYQWYASGKVIPGATASTYKLASAQKGKAIQVKVTGKKTGYATISKTSAATAKIR